MNQLKETLEAKENVKLSPRKTGVAENEDGIVFDRDFTDGQRATIAERARANCGARRKLIAETRLKLQIRPESATQGKQHPGRTRRKPKNALRGS